MIDNILTVSLINYFFFYLLNHSLMFSSIKKQISYKYNFYKVSGSRFRHFFYALICPICFPFHLSVLTVLIPNIIFDIKNLQESLILCCTVPVICLLIDNTVLFLAKK